MRRLIAECMGKARPHRGTRRLLSVYLPGDCKERLLTCREQTGYSMCEILTTLIRQHIGEAALPAPPRPDRTMVPAGEVLQSGPYKGMRRQPIEPATVAQPDWINYGGGAARGASARI